MRKQKWRAAAAAAAISVIGTGISADSLAGGKVWKLPQTVHAEETETKETETKETEIEETIRNRTRNSSRNGIRSPGNGSRG